MKDTQRIFSLDLLRVIACYLVIQVHAGEFFYIGDGGSVLEGDGAFWVNIFNSIGRTAVPLFIMLTGYLVLPIKSEMSVFFKKRFTRVVIPFVVWCVVYAVYQFAMGDVDLPTMGLNILKIPVNFGTEVGHLWYIYMLIGLYLFFPIISHWLKQASKKEVQFYLIIWGVTLLLPYIHLVFPEVLGECFWNNTPLLYYFSGFLGYAILGFYLKKFYEDKANIFIGLLLLISGYAITTLVFNDRLLTETQVSSLELSWNYGTINVAMMSLGLFMLLKNIKCSTGLTKVIADISNMSYGMYLVHIIVLNFFYQLIDGVALFDHVVCKLFVLTIPTFIVSYIVIKIISKLPKSKYIIG